MQIVQKKKECPKVFRVLSKEEREKRDEERKEEEEEETLQEHEVRTQYYRT